MKPAIIRRIDLALAVVEAKGWKPAFLHLTPADDRLYVRAATAEHRHAFGSKATCWPSSYGDLHIAAGSLWDKLTGSVSPGHSAILCGNGEVVFLPSRVP